MSGCDCYKIGGPFIAEDPDCPVHGQDGLLEQYEEKNDRIEQLEADLAALRKLFEESGLKK